MKIWSAMKRLNQRYNAWATHTANRIVADLDRSPRDGCKPERKRQLSVWDLLSQNCEPGR
jgi:hypothetical protein